MEKQLNKKKVILVIAIILIVLILVLLKKFYIKSDYEKLTILYDNEYLDLSEINDNFSVFVDNDLNVFMYKEDVMQLFDESLYYNVASKEIITTYGTHITRLLLDDYTAEFDDQEITLKNLPKEENDTIILPITELAPIYDIEIKFSNRSNRIIINSLDKEKTEAIILRKNMVKSGKGFFSRNVEKLIIGDKVTVLEKDDKWAKVATPLGNIGYIKVKYMTDIEKIRENREETKLKSIEYYKNYSNMSGVYSDITVDEEKYNIISPTFYYIKKEGNIINRSTSSSAAYSIYFDWAGRNKLTVIPAVEMENAVSDSLNSYQKRKNAINKLIEYAVNNSYEGININIDDVDDIYSFNRFVIEASPRFKAANVKLILTKTQQVDQGKLKEYVDYIIQK